MSDLDIKNIADIEILRSYYHSINIENTYDAILALKKINSVDSSRELIQLYNECLWRSIKIEILKALGSHSNQRSIEFMIQVAKNDEDLPLALISIESLGNTQSPLALRFLENLYSQGHKSKKPAVTLALVKLLSVSMQDVFISDLKLALEKNEIQLAKSLIYALGELKYHKGISVLVEILQMKSINKEISLSSLVSLGKLCRDTAYLEKFKENYKSDALDYQIYQQALNQVGFRSHWKIEDYFQKFFNSDEYHQNLPLEFNAFNAEDIQAGLQIFKSPKNISKVFKILSYLNNPIVFEWYVSFLEQESITDELALLASQSIAFHKSDKAEKIIQLIEKYDLDLAHDAAVTCLPKADLYLRNFILSEKYQKSSDDFKIRTINRLTSFLLCQIQQVDSGTQLPKFFESEILNENSTHVKNRWIRAAAQCDVPHYKIYSLFEQLPENQETTKSVLFYLEKCPNHQSTQFLKRHFLSNKNENILATLKACVAQDSHSFDTKEIDSILKIALNQNTEEEVKITALQLLSKNKFIEFKKSILELTRDSSTQIALNSIITLKNYNDEDIPDILIPHLKSPSESIRGRTVDVLIHNNSLRAKRILLDFLKQNIQYTFIAEKIIRNLAESKIKSEYFVSAVDELIQNKTNSDLADQLIDLKSCLEAEFLSDQMALLPSEADIIEIDRNISDKLSHYAKYDPTVKASLRSAEMPFNKPELFNKYVDKSVCILGFTKAIDIFIEKQLGKKLLYPKLEAKLHEFQNIIHLAKLHEDYVDTSQLVKNLSVEKYFTNHSIPAHKMTLIAKGFINAKLLNEQFKILDGLRAWGIIILLFCRKNLISSKPLIPLAADDHVLAELSKKLMWLQDLRNPVAHRQTLTVLDGIKEIREESYKTLQVLEKLLMS